MTFLDIDIKKAQVILMCGLPGSGKSTLAKKLSKSLKAKLLSSDEIRKKVFKSSQFDNRGDIFVTGLKPKYYDLLFKEAKKSILKDKKVIIDASNMDKQRTILINKISSLIDKSKMLILVIKTPKKTITQRMKKIKKMNTKTENYFSAWKRVYGYFEKHLKEGIYSWPKENEGVKIIEI